MKQIILVLSIIISICTDLVFASPKIGLNELLIQSELNPQNVISARSEAVRQQLPVSIITKSKIKYDVMSVENGRPVYAVITNFADIFKGGYTSFYEDIKFNSADSRIDYGNGNIKDNTNGFFNPIISDNLPVTKYLMIPDITTDRIYLFNAANGDLVDTAFTPTSRPQLSTPKHAISHFNGKDILLADQITDLVQRFNSDGTYTGFFAPVGGVNNSILDNIRGIRYRANNNLFVTVGSGPNQNTIQEFDTAGNHIGTFIGTTNLNSPFDILLRTGDMLISNSSGANRITRFDLSGNFLSVFSSSTSFAFPQQMIELPNGNIVVAGFSIPSGIVVLNSSGTFVKLLTGITGNRGVYLLGNGNYLTTNGAGVHEIDSASGSLVRSVLNTGSFQYISEYQTAALRLTLTINFEACNEQDSITVELRSAVSPYNLIDSSKGMGGKGIKRRIDFFTAANSTPYYIVVKHRNSIETWSSATPSFTNGTLYYDFTLANTQAFGNNLINAGGKWSLYVGDVNQDGIVDASDVSLVDNDALSGVFGSALTDLNCDGIVDVSDLSVIDNNSTNSVSVISP
ncbi:MAG: hypothetical protein WAU38_05870 [Ignavibacteria bacterium]|nr:hypothetical protein [Ignavibacteria bacterium]